jgi:hypothetical protein
MDGIKNEGKGRENEWLLHMESKEGVGPNALIGVVVSAPSFPSVLRRFKPMNGFGNFYCIFLIY